MKTSNPFKTMSTKKKLTRLASAFGVLTKKSTLTFGKYNTLPVKHILKVDPGYLCWVHDNTTHKLHSSVITEARMKSALQELKQQSSKRASPRPLYRSSKYNTERHYTDSMDADECYDLYGPDPVDCGPFW